MADGHRSKPTSWATVIVLILGFALVAVALPAQSVLLAVFGAIVLLAGVVMGVAFRIMDDFH